MTGLLAVTGGTGFIGSAVIDAALRRGWRVRALARRPIPRRTGLECRLVDLTWPDVARLHDALEGADALAHCASAIHQEVRVLHDVNVVGTRHVLEACRARGIERVGVVSTASVYEDGEHRGVREGVLAEHPGSTTSQSRLEADRLVRAAGGFSVRPHLVVGPRDTWVVPSARQALESIGWVGDGQALQSFVDVRDLARLMVLLMEAAGASGEAVHCSAAPRSWRQVLRPHLSDDHELWSRPPTSIDAMRSRWPGGEKDRALSLLGREHTYDVGRAVRLTGWSAAHDPASPDAASLAWYRQSVKRAST